MRSQKSYLESVSVARHLPSRAAAVLAISALTVFGAAAATSQTDAAGARRSAAVPHSAAATPSASSADGNAVRGKALFIKNGCYACHGYEGQGSIYTGPRIAPNPSPWQAIAAFIRNPPGVRQPYYNWPFKTMPPFTAKLVPDGDVRDIYAYLKSVPGLAALKSIPTFKKSRR